MNESTTNITNTEITDISIHTNKGTILINSLKNVVIRSENKEYLYPFSNVEQLTITGECDNVDDHIYLFSRA